VRTNTEQACQRTKPPKETNNQIPLKTLRSKRAKLSPKESQYHIGGRILGWLLVAVGVIFATRPVATKMGLLIIIARGCSDN
jgi:hypothetical protein